MKQKKWKDISKEIEKIRETIEMVKNSNHSASEKTNMHSYANPKELMLNPKTFVSIATLAKDVGLERKRIIHWIKHLEEEGWITVKRRGFNLSNWYVLHSKKKYKKK